MKIYRTLLTIDRFQPMSLVLISKIVAVPGIVTIIFVRNGETKQLLNSQKQRLVKSDKDKKQSLR